MSPTFSLPSKPHFTIALLHWGDRIEDFLDTIGVSFESFCNDMTGGWMFGYIEALRLAGVRTVLFCISAQVTTPEHHIHKPTGATICVLPAPQIHQQIRRPMLNPYGWTVRDVFGDVGRWRRPWYALLKDIAPYLATPVVSLARELRREGCQAILCQEYEYARFDVCVGLGQILRIPVFATFQGGDVQLSRLEHPLRPFSLRQCAGLIVATQTEIGRLETHYSLSSDKIAQIFNPMDVANWHAVDRAEARRQLEIPSEACVVVCHGRIELHRKGLDVLMQAWSQICRDRPHRDLRLLLLGTGSDAVNLQHLIEVMQLRGVMWRNEYVNDRTVIRQYLSAADLYTLPSRHEGFPVAPIEAMACSLPVVAADAPGVPDILNQGELSGGIIVPRGDAAALATALGRLIDDDSLRQELGHRARSRAEHSFAYASVGQELANFLVQRSTQPKS